MLQIADIHIGPECEVKISEAAGVVTIAIAEGTPGIEAGLNVKIPLNYFVGKLSDIIPNVGVKQALAAVSAVLATL